MKEVPVSVGRRAEIYAGISFCCLPEFPVGNITLAKSIIANCNHSSVCFQTNGMVITCRNCHYIRPKV